MAKTYSSDAGELDVAYVAHLARMHLTGEEIREFQGQLDQVLAYVDQLKELDVDGIEPTAHAIPVENVLRDDIACPRSPEQREAQLDNAPARQGDEFLVPRILE